MYSRYIYIYLIFLSKYTMYFLFSAVVENELTSCPLDLMFFFFFIKLYSVWDFFISLIFCIYTCSGFGHFFYIFPTSYLNELLIKVFTSCA